MPKALPHAMLRRPGAQSRGRRYDAALRTCNSASRHSPALPRASGRDAAPSSVNRQKRQNLRTVGAAQGYAIGNLTNMRRRAGAVAAWYETGQIGNDMTTQNNHPGSTSLDEEGEFLQQVCVHTAPAGITRRMRAWWRTGAGWMERRKPSYRHAGAGLRHESITNRSCAGRTVPEVRPCAYCHGDVVPQGRAGQAAYGGEIERLNLWRAALCQSAIRDYILRWPRWKGLACHSRGWVERTFV